MGVSNKEKSPRQWRWRFCVRLASEPFTAVAEDWSSSEDTLGTGPLAPGFICGWCGWKREHPQGHPVPPGPSRAASPGAPPVTQVSGKRSAVLVPAGGLLRADSSRHPSGVGRTRISSHSWILKAMARSLLARSSSFTSKATTRHSQQPGSWTALLRSLILQLSADATERRRSSATPPAAPRVGAGDTAAIVPADSSRAFGTRPGSALAAPRHQTFRPGGSREGGVCWANSKGTAGSCPENPKLHWVKSTLLGRHRHPRDRKIFKGTREISTFHSASSTAGPGNSGVSHCWNEELGILRLFGAFENSAPQTERRPFLLRVCSTHSVFLTASPTA